MTNLLTIKTTSRVGTERHHLSRRAMVRALQIVLATGFFMSGVIAPSLAGATDNTITVEISNFVYSPEVITVTAGTTVIWVNNDDTPHTVTATEEAFRSPPLDTEDTFKFTFTTPGEYAYFCALHPHMTGEVIVRPIAG